MKKWIICCTVLIFLCGCAEHRTQALYDKLSEDYLIKYQKFNSNENIEISVELIDRETKERKIYIIYDVMRKENCCILFYNENPEIPIKRFYAKEPETIYYEEKAEYLPYLDKLEKEYKGFLKSYDTSSQQLLNLSKNIEKYAETIKNN